MRKAVIFDLDGLLIDSEIISYKIYQQLLCSFGVDFTVEEYAESYSGKTGIKNMENLIAAYSLPWKLEEGLERVDALESEYLAQGVKLKAGAKELLAYLKDNGYKIALASSSTEERALTILEQHKIKDYFNEFAFGYEVEKGKPEPDIFLLAARKLGELPEDCLVLEDSEAGIQAAYAAKMAVICIPDMKRPSQSCLEKTTNVLKSLQDVISVLEAL